MSINYIISVFQIAVLMVLIAPQNSYGQQLARCQIFSSSGRPASVQGDEFYKLLVNLAACPQNIGSVNQVLDSAFSNRKFLVANRGRNNPRMGSFSIFESFASKNRAGDAGIFLGHFTQLKNQNGKSIIDLDQAPDKGKLVIELIAWDAVKGYYNFYELIGQGPSNQWFYRGDSKDILMDNQAIYLNSTPQSPPFGQTLRCSGCHLSGGPIMKEISFPHNDWWVKSRPLVFENAQSPEFLQRLRALDTAENFASQVQTGIQKLENSPSYQNVKKSLGVRAQLRPLFCDLEINIESDVNASDSGAMVQIPTSSVAGPFSGPFKLATSKSVYSGLLQKYRMQFPETSHLDADHPWLTPVKGYSDLVAIGKLKAFGLVDDKTILDISYSAAVGSLMNKEKCSLLKLVPNSMDWKTGFLQNLKTQTSTVAKSMYQRMTNNALTPLAYQQAMNTWYQQTSQKLAKGDIESYFTQLMVNRKAVFESEISKNPKGQILEPGFRVIFPLPRVNFR